MLELSNAAFLFAPGKGVCDISVNIASGSCIGVIGANGAGKSTLLALVAGALVPQNGTICFTKQTLKGRRKKIDAVTGIEYRRNVGYMPEMIPMYDEMTVADYLRFRAKLKGERYLRLRRRVTEAIERCSLSNWRDEKISSLSAGLRKRTALAEAILLLPQILVLDDPFAGVDSVSREKIISVVKDLSGRAVVLISGHDCKELSECCTQFLVLQNGRLIATESQAVKAFAKIRGDAEK